MSDEDYKRGYREGFADGFKKGQESFTPKPVWPPLGAPTIPPSITCQKCKINFQGVVGYVCPNLDCPTFLSSGK